MEKDNIVKESVYLSEIEPLAHKIYSLCNSYQIPVFMAFSFDEWKDIGYYDISRKKLESNESDEIEDELSDDEFSEANAKKKAKKYMSIITNTSEKKAITEKNVIKAKCLVAEFFGGENPDKRFSRFVNVVNGFETILKRRPEELVENVDDFGMLDIDDVPDSDEPRPSIESFEEKRVDITDFEDKIQEQEDSIIKEEAPRRRGRPKGSKNKPKE